MKHTVNDARALVAAAAWIREGLERYRVAREELALADRLAESAEEVPHTREAAFELVRAYAAAAPGRVQGFGGWHRWEKREHLERLRAAGHGAEVKRLTAPPAKIGELYDPNPGATDP